MAKSANAPDIFDKVVTLEKTRAQQLTMGLSPKKETTDGQAANPQPAPTVEPSDTAAQADGDGDAG